MTMRNAPAPPLAPVAGQRDLAVAAGLGGGAGALLWRAACYGCGAVVACTPLHPQPECTGCGRARHGVIDRPPPPRGTRIPPTHSALGPSPTPSTTPPTSPSKTPSPVTVLRPSAPIAPDDPAMPGGVRRLAGLAAAEGWPVSVTAALASDAAGAVASVALRVRGLGYAVYRRRAGAWEFFRAAVADPVVRPVNVGQFEAALLRLPYTPPQPRPPASKVLCPTCGAEVSLTAAGKIYASHKCQSKTTEGRS